MSKDFEKYFEDIREDLDTRTPNEEKIWFGIDRQLRNKQNDRKLILWRAAAVLLAFVSVAQLTYILTEKSRATPLQLTLVSEDSGAFRSLEASYQQEMNVLEKRLAEKKVSRDEYALFFEEMDFIKALEDETREEIPLTNDREKLARILVDTYEKKIQLLERLLEQVERDEKQEEQMEKGLMPMKNNHKTLAI